MSREDEEHFRYLRATDGYSSFFDVRDDPHRIVPERDGTPRNHCSFLYVWRRENSRPDIRRDFLSERERRGARSRGRFFNYSRWIKREGE